MVYICNGLIFIFGFIIEGYYTTQETSCTNEVDALRTFPYEVSVGRKVLSNRDRPSYPFKGRVLSNRDRPSIPFKEGSYPTGIDLPIPLKEGSYPTGIDLPIPLKEGSYPTGIDLLFLLRKGLILSYTIKNI